MLCEKCHIRPACVHIRAYGPDGQQDHNLCLQCAITTMPDQADLSRFLQVLEENSKETGVKLPVPLEELKRLAKLGEAKSSEKRCPTCGMGLSDLLRQRRLGCRECLSAFREDLRDILREPLAEQRRHKASCSGLPQTSGEPSYAQIRLAELREDLARAVKAEQYERAAQLQQQITAFTQDLTQESPQSLLPLEDTYTQLCAEVRALPENSSGAASLAPVWAPRQMLPDMTIRLSGVVRYSRNLADFPLPPYPGATIHEASEPADLLLKFLKADPLFADATLIQPTSENRAESLHLTHCGLAPASFLNRPYPVYLLLSANRRVIARINHEEHLQLEIWGEKGDQLRAIQVIQAFDARLQRRFHLATDAEFGAVTHRVSSLGSGIQIAEFLHLPALCMEDRQNSLANACHELHLAIQPFFPQKGPHPANIMVLLNEFALGDTLNRRCRQVTRAAAILERHEREARCALQNNEPQRLSLLDRLGRAAGTIKGARLVEADEARHLLSMLWLGHELGVFPQLNWAVLFRDYARLPLGAWNAGAGDAKTRHLASVTARMLRHDFGHEEDME
ncbi:MAG: UvrB/UvrC motif-containing protein [Victivallales bacterium]|nr:UvrB/UvrC motif-containing protein [Victivallales bacterium]